MHLWTYLVLRIGGADALQQMIQSGDWNTDACKAAGDEVLKLNALKPYQDGYKSATYDNEAAAVGNGKAAMELMGQWAPGVQVADSTSKKGLGDRPRLVPVPGRHRRRGRSHGRRRRRQRHRGRQERTARGGRLPQVLQQRRERQLAQQLDATDRAVAGHRAPRARSPTRTCRPSWPAATRRTSSSCTSTRRRRRPWARRSMRRRSRCSSAIDAGEGLPGDHGRGRHAVAIRLLHNTASMATMSGPAHAGPLDFSLVAEGRT